MNVVATILVTEKQYNIENPFQILIVLQLIHKQKLKTERKKTYPVANRFSVARHNLVKQ